MQRRDFVKGLGLLAPTLLSCQGRGTVPPSEVKHQSFRVGHATTTHLYQEKSTASFWRGVEDLSALGFRGTEADNMIAHLSGTYGDRPEEFLDRMAQHKMALPALYHVVPEDFVTRDREALLAEMMKVGEFISKVRGHIFNLSGPEPMPATNDRVGLIHALAEFGNELGHRLQEEYGVSLGYHPEGGGLLLNREHVAILMDAAQPKSFNFCPDTGHLTHMKCDALEVLRTYRSRVIHLHAKDWDPKLEDHNAAEIDRGFAVLGEGVVDFPPIVSFLEESNYTGWFMIELDPPRQGPLADSRANLNYATDVLGLSVGADETTHVMQHQNRG